MEEIFYTKNLDETQDLARVILEKVAKNSKKNSAAVLGLVGDLGGGKTSFTQGLAKILGIKEDVLSPTFILMQSYAVKNNNFPWDKIIHFDVYRTKSSDELLRLGWGEILSDEKNLIIVEWADLVENIMPKNSIWINFEWLEDKERKIILSDKNGKTKK